MSKPHLTKQEFVDEINSRIKSNALSHSRMTAKFYPEGASAETATGVMYEGPEGARGMFETIEAEVRKEFSVAGDPQAED